MTEIFEKRYLIISSGDYVWTRGEVWSKGGTPYLISGGLLQAQRELSRAEMYRREEYPEVSGKACITEVTLCGSSKLLP